MREMLFLLVYGMLFIGCDCAYPKSRLVAKRFRDSKPVVIKSVTFTDHIKNHDSLLSLDVQSPKISPKDHVSSNLGVRQLNNNEFTFGSQVDIGPNSVPGNVKIIHGTPPQDFMDEFKTQTMFPPTRITTFFTAPSSPPDLTKKPTTQPPAPWMWYKKPKPTTSHPFHPTPTHRSLRPSPSVHRTVSPIPSRTPPHTPIPPQQGQHGHSSEAMVQPQRHPPGGLSTNVTGGPASQTQNPSALGSTENDKPTADGEVVLENAPNANQPPQNNSISVKPAVGVAAPPTSDKLKKPVTSDGSPVNLSNSVTTPNKTGGPPTPNLHKELPSVSVDAANISKPLTNDQNVSSTTSKDKAKSSSADTSATQSSQADSKLQHTASPVSSSQQVVEPLKNSNTTIITPVNVTSPMLEGATNMIHPSVAPAKIIRVKENSMYSNNQNLPPSIVLPVNIVHFSDRDSVNQSLTKSSTLEEEKVALQPNKASNAKNDTILQNPQNAHEQPLKWAVEHVDAAPAKILSVTYNSADEKLFSKSTANNISSFESVPKNISQPTKIQADNSTASNISVENTTQSTAIKPNSTTSYINASAHNTTNEQNIKSHNSSESENIESAKVGQISSVSFSTDEIKVEDTTETRWKPGMELPILRHPTIFGYNSLLHGAIRPTAKFRAKLMKDTKGETRQQFTDRPFSNYGHRGSSGVTDTSKNKRSKVTKHAASSLFLLPHRKQAFKRSPTASFTEIDELMKPTVPIARVLTTTKHDLCMDVLGY